MLTTNVSMIIIILCISIHHPSIQPSIHPSIHPSTCTCIYPHPPTHPSIHLSNHWSLYTLCYSSSNHIVFHAWTILCMCVFMHDPQINLHTKAHTNMHVVMRIVFQSRLPPMFSHETHSMTHV